MSHLGLVTLVVMDYDEAIAFYRDAVGFDLVEDTRLDDRNAGGWRWWGADVDGSRPAWSTLSRELAPGGRDRLGGLGPRRSR